MNWKTLLLAGAVALALSACKPAGEGTDTAADPAASEPAATEPATTEPAATEPATTEPAATEPATTEPAATEPAATEPAATEPAAVAEGDSIGVPECDDYLAKYMACVSDKVPEAARAQFEQSLSTTREQWKQAAATPEGKANLVQACTTAREQAKSALGAFGCEL